MSAMHGEHVVLTVFTGDAYDEPFVVEFSDDALPVDDPGDSDGGASLYGVTALRHSDYGIIVYRFLVQIARGADTGIAYPSGDAVTIDNVSHVSGSTFSFNVNKTSPGSLMIIVTREMCQWPLHT